MTGRAALIRSSTAPLFWRASSSLNISGHTLVAACNLEPQGTRVAGKKGASNGIRWWQISLKLLKEQESTLLSNEFFNE